MRYALAIFDLDGTLADSFPWFLRIVNSVADKHRFRRIEAGEGWMGGALAPPVWVAEGLDVVLTVNNHSNRKAQFLFEIKEDYSQLGAQSLVAEPGSNTLHVRIRSTSGLANYLAVSKLSQEIDIISIALKPGPTNLAQKKP